SLLAIVVCTLAGWVIVEHVDVIGLLIRPIAPLIPGGKLRVTGPTEPFFITLKFAFVLGLVLASPVVGYHVWAFLVPALYPRERDVGAGGRPARAARRRLHAPDEGAVVAPLRGRELVRVGGRAASRAPGARGGGCGERGRARGPARPGGRRARRPDTAAVPADSGRHDAAHRRGLGRSGPPRHRHRSPARLADRADAQLSAVRRRDRLAPQAAGISHHA